MNTFVITVLCKPGSTSPVVVEQRAGEQFLPVRAEGIVDPDKQLQSVLGECDLRALVVANPAGLEQMGTLLWMPRATGSLPSTIPCCTLPAMVDFGG